MRKVILTCFSLLSACLFVAYVFSCFTPYINPAGFRPVTFFGLTFPLIAVATIGCAIGWLFINQKSAVFALILLLCAGYQNIRAVFAFNFPAQFQLQRDSSTLRILHWNVKNFSDNSRRAEATNPERREMLNYIREVNSDVILMEEFLEITSKEHYSNVRVLCDTLGYKYYYISNDKVEERGNVKTNYGCAIFSKFPLGNIHHYPFTNTCASKSLSYADLVFNGKKLRLATTHLCSLNLGEPKNNAEYFGRVDRDFILHSSQLEKLMHYDSIHGRQADFIHGVIDTSILPVIITGDFNSVPSGYAYHTIKGKLQDAFVEKGAGFGRTFTGLFPTLRIDYVLVDKKFKVIQYTSPRLYLSDHFPVIADVQWR